MGPRRLRSVFALSSVLVVACSGSAPSDLFDDESGFGALPDAGSTVDASTATDAGAPVSADAGLLGADATTPVDSGAPRVDSGAPVVDSAAPVDAGAPVVDAGRDAGPPARTFRCGQAGAGGTSCTSVTEDCCADLSGSRASYSCVTEGACTSLDAVALECATSADCTAGNVCCGYLDSAQSSWNVVVCTASCTSQNGLTAYVFCNPTAPNTCPSGRSCRASQVLSGYGYCQ